MGPRKKHARNFDGAPSAPGSGNPTLCGRWGRTAALIDVDCVKCLAVLEKNRRIAAQRRLAERLVAKAKKRLPGLADLESQPRNLHYYLWYDWVAKAAGLLCREDWPPARVESWLVGEFHRALQLYRDVQVETVRRALESKK